ncbi:MAG: TolC family protein [Acidobacteria bacterium]|nr:TolC family protein [Acidobacteriota bacterium]
MIHLLCAAAILVTAQTPPEVELTLARATELALAPDGNARALLAREFVRAAEIRSKQARSAFLPDLASSFTYASQTRNLQAFGFDVRLPFPGVSIPTFVGPFTVADARATVSQTVFDLAAMRRYKAARLHIEQARAEERAAQEAVRQQVARAWLWTLRAKALADAARASVDLGESLLKLAENQKAAGTGTGIDVTRARAELAAGRQRLAAATNESDRARLGLLRATGLRLDTPFHIAGTLAVHPVDQLDPAQATGHARANRQDLAAQRQRQSAAQVSLGAVSAERLPSVHAGGDYGTIGRGLDRTLPTRTIGLSVRVPLWDAGRRDLRRAESAINMRTERIRVADLEQQVEYEVRAALEAIDSAVQQIGAAEEGLTLSENELAQARRRYEAGFAASIELHGAQTRLAAARDARIAALYNHNLARLELGAAMGTLQQFVQ